MMKFGIDPDEMVLTFASNEELRGGKLGGGCAAGDALASA
jgi:hypothetical protein